jgi:hypothetical protein
MTRLLTRENVKLAVVAVACLLIAWTGPAAARTVADYAKNADKVDGKHAVGAGASKTQAKNKLVAHDRKGQLPAKFVPKSFVTEREYKARTKTIVTTHSGGGWKPHVWGPTSFLNYVSNVLVSGDGGVFRTLDAPRSVGSARYGLDKIEFCFTTSGGAAIDLVEVYDSDPVGSVLVTDETDRTSSSGVCRTLNVRKRVTFGADFYVELKGGGTAVLRGVRAYWDRSVANVAPRTAAKGRSGVTRP